MKTVFTMICCALWYLTLSYVFLREIGLYPPVVLLDIITMILIYCFALIIGSKVILLMGSDD